MTRLAIALSVFASVFMSMYGIITLLNLDYTPPVVAAPVTNNAESIATTDLEAASTLRAGVSTPVQWTRTLHNYTLQTPENDNFIHAPGVPSLRVNPDIRNFRVEYPASTSWDCYGGTWVPDFPPDPDIPLGNQGSSGRCVWTNWDLQDNRSVASAQTVDVSAIPVATVPGTQEPLFRTGQTVRFVWDCIPATIAIRLQSEFCFNEIYTILGPQRADGWVEALGDDHGKWMVNPNRAIAFEYDPVEAPVVARVLECQITETGDWVEINPLAGTAAGCHAVRSRITAVGGSAGDTISVGDINTWTPERTTP